MGAMWRPRVLPDAVPRASAGGFERLLHEREGFGLPLNGQWTCGGKFDGPPEFDFCEREPGAQGEGGRGGERRAAKAMVAAGESSKHLQQSMPKEFKSRVSGGGGAPRFDGGVPWRLEPPRAHNARAWGNATRRGRCGRAV